MVIVIIVYVAIAVFLCLILYRLDKESERLDKVYNFRQDLIHILFERDNWKDLRDEFTLVGFGTMCERPYKPLESYFEGTKLIEAYREEKAKGDIWDTM